MNYDLQTAAVSIAKYKLFRRLYIRTCGNEIIWLLESVDKIAKILLIKFWDGLEAHPTRKKIFVGWALSSVLTIFARSLVSAYNQIFVAN